MKFTNEIEKLDTLEIANSKYINIDFFKNSTILVTGATGLIGSQFVRSVLYINEAFNANIRVFVLVRNLTKAQKMFENNVEYIVQDITEKINISENIDFIVHTANGTASKDFVECPVETIDTILSGTKNILELAKNCKAKSIVYLSSMEVYGITDFNTDKPIKENELGYVDIYEARNSYPEGKRMAEMMCSSYFHEYNIPVKTARLVQTIGSGAAYNDNRVFAQFARNIAEHKDIILHTMGESVRGYSYVTDTIIALYVLLERGVSGECYNIANDSAVCSIREMAEMLCKRYKTSGLKMELENSNSKYYLPKIKLILDTEKIKSLGWSAEVSLEDMYDRLIRSFKSRGNV